ncbi:MAG: hypothetical protein JSV43_08270 [Methanobacteriota archaeon]|nr:MAG: hypothetical protein JSV43_08270 [Euryarchaeota archaeon]
MKRRTARILTVELVVCLAALSMVSHVFANEDIDGDGLADWWELQYFGDLGQVADGDFDGDDFTNLEEFEAETDPADANEGPRPPSANPT